MIVWLLMFSTGLGASAIPGIATKSDCEALAVSLDLADYKCFSYRAAR